ncbi:hypothetical protein [Streptomyces sp. H27-C3]|uniref:hypothetical protein n=1 Tax=Streptomyces sp. H27-C3 TaxID=3046305 RepID=UPI0024B9C2B9|nr:hypothetical protein [Streptomyces sp. H27-C3]MDJ0466667.1 hypothetical protein [Streptomyces sp. H27-C3]
MRRWGLSFKRSDRRAAGQEAEAVRRWHEETWPAIRAKADSGEVLFAAGLASARTRSPAGPGARRAGP